MIKMDNNLDYCIRQSGMTKKEVASRKGLTPESLSRHISGRHQLNLQDAEEYARILGCSTHEVIFKSTPIKILFTFEFNLSGIPKISRCEAPRLYQVHSPMNFNVDMFAVRYDFTPDYKGPREDYRDALGLCALEPLRNQMVCHTTFQKRSIICKANGDLVPGELYPEPGGTYTIYNPYLANDLLGEHSVQRQQRIKWASPVLTEIMRPEILGFMQTKIKTD